MSLYQDSKISVVQNTNNQRDVHITSTSSFHGSPSGLEQSPIAKPNQFSSSIRSDPLVGLIDGSVDARGSSGSMQASIHSNYLPNTTMIDASHITKQTVIDDAKFNQTSNIQKSSQKTKYGITDQNSNFKSHVTFANTQQNLVSHGVPPVFQSVNNSAAINPMFNTNLGQSPNQANVNWMSQIPRSVSTSNMRQKVPFPASSASVNKSPGSLVPIPTSNGATTSNAVPLPPTSNAFASNHRSQFGIQDSATNPVIQSDFKIPNPVYFEDEETGTYGVRCVCGKAHHDGLLVQCDKCQFWLHAICNCIARESKDEPFFCPFCRLRIIRCKCGNNSQYDIPIVQCAQCKYWVHKRCEHLGFGVIPTTFICSNCGGNEFTMPILKPVFKNSNKVSFVDCDRYEVIQSIPEGQFRNFVIADLNRSELHLHETVGRYFQEFAIPLFQKTHEFWKIFVDTLVTMINCDKNDILDTIDDYARCFLYAKNFKKRKFAKPIKFSMSESIIPIVEGNCQSLPHIDDRSPKELYLNPSGAVCVAEACEEDSFICELPGFLVHTDEVYADEGIPLNFIKLYNSDLIVDMDGSPFQYAPKINRSFHFNCYAKLYISDYDDDDVKKVDNNENSENLAKLENSEESVINEADDKNIEKKPVSENNKKNVNLLDKIRVGLFATRMKGPLQDMRRGTPVTADSQLFLPLDGYIPYTLPKCEWKSPRAKAKVKSNSRSKTQQKKNEVSGQHVDNIAPINLSLLTAFCEDMVPPIPITLVNEKDTVSRAHVGPMVRSRRTSRVRVNNDG